MFSFGFSSLVLTDLIIIFSKDEYVDLNDIKLVQRLSPKKNVDSEGENNDQNHDSNSNYPIEITHFETARRQAGLFSRFYTDFGPKESWNESLKKVTDAPKNVKKSRSSCSMSSKTAMSTLNNFPQVQSLISENESKQLLSQVKSVFSEI